MNDKEILALASKTIRTEINALEQVIGALGEDFIKCVREIEKLPGRVIVSGIGKSAIIAQKMVATFNSVGTPSLYMHAADALHGDLGMVQQDDLIILISKSGETEEMVNLAIALQNFDIKKIAIVKNQESTMAKMCDIILLTPIIQEADPNNLAPTASTIAQMSLGDALASCLVLLNNFTPTDFAVYHPGGNLGTRLNLRIKDLISSEDPPKVHENNKLMDVLQQISAGRKGAVGVVDANHNLVGIITDGDVRRSIEKNGISDATTASEIMTQDPVTVDAETRAIDTLELMEKKDISQVIVKENHTFIAIIHIHDLLDRGLQI